jgi:L,D-transpeptidase ErfK/SrfK
VRHQSAFGLAHLDVRDARTGRIVAEIERGVEQSRRIGRRLLRQERTAREQRGRQRQPRRRAEGAGLAFAICLLSISATAAPPVQSADVDGYAALRAPLGSLQTDFVEPKDTLLDVAARHRLGFEAVARLNPGLDPWIPPPGTVVRLPTRYLLPQAAPAGLVVNIPEMRLYDFGVSDGPEVLAVAIGDAEDPTPVGEFRIGGKRIDPEWRVPASIRAEKPELPAVVAPGPENPLGSRWLTIGNSSYGLHGTNVRWSIGRIATHGCVRLYEEDVVRLYDRVRQGTRLQLVYQPYKWGREGNRLLLEAHPDIYARIPDPLAAALEVPRALGLEAQLDIAAVRRVIQRASGVPTQVGTLPPPASDLEGLLRDPLLEDRLGLAGRVFGGLRRAACVGRSLLGRGGAALGVLGRSLDACDALVERIEPAVDLVDVAARRAAREPHQQRGSQAG